MGVKIFSDGGARGNPGVAGYGVVVKDENGKIIYQEKKYLGIKTNNEAEYEGLIAGLNWVSKNMVDEAEFYMDSQLLVRQMRGEYKVKAINLIELYRKAMKLAKGKKIKFIDIRRELNKEADALANLAMDEKK